MIKTNKKRIDLMALEGLIKTAMGWERFENKAEPIGFAGLRTDINEDGETEITVLWKNSKTNKEVKAKTLTANQINTINSILDQDSVGEITSELKDQLDEA